MQQRQSCGFTLIELMVVVVILGLFVALVLPKMFGRVGESKQKTSKAQIEMFSTTLGMFRLDVGKYPSTTEGLQVLRTRPSGIENWKRPYIGKEIPNDPWGRLYHYASPGTHDKYDLYSYGADNTEGDEGEDSDHGCRVQSIRGAVIETMLAVLTRAQWWTSIAY